MICVLGGLGNMVGAFVASFVMSEIISIAGVLWSTEMGYVIAFVVFIVMMFARPGGILAKRRDPGARRRGPLPRRLVAGPVLPLGGTHEYILHVMIQIFIWSFIGGAWSLMGRFGLVSLGHGAFLGARRLHDHAAVELLRAYAVAGGVVAVLLTGGSRSSSPTPARASRWSATTSASSPSRWAR